MFDQQTLLRILYPQQQGIADPLLGVGVPNNPVAIVGSSTGLTMAIVRLLPHQTRILRPRLHRPHPLQIGFTG